MAKKFNLRIAPKPSKTQVKTIKLQNKYLLWALNIVLDTRNGCSVTNESDDTFVRVFDRK